MESLVCMGGGAYFTVI
uniref:Uncharacterized protein n=1 Tax=Anguilla anguilla TaxID=7936 RepID=A0A0E9V1J0_ANGAN